MLGIARGELRQVAALTGGRLLMVPVRLFDKVAEGQTLAVLQDEHLQAQWATAAAEANRLQTDCAAAEETLASRWRLEQAAALDDARQVAFDAEGAHLRVLELTALIEMDRITLQGLRYKLDVTRLLYEKNAATLFEVQWAQTEHDALGSKIVENEKVLEEAQGHLAAAEQRLKDYTAARPLPPAMDKVLAPLRQAVVVQQRRMDELALERAMLVVRSPLEGYVSGVLRGAGETVAAREPIVTIAAAEPSEVVAYATADQARQMRAGARVQLVRRGLRPAVTESEIAGLGPDAVQLPPQMWRNPALPEWGWPMRIVARPELQLKPGEVVGVRRL